MSAITPEGKVKKRVKEILKKHNVYYCMPLGQSFGKAGVPDIIACANGQFIGIECKAGGNKCTKLQELEQEAIRTAGGCAIVVDDTSFDAFEAWIQTVLNMQVAMQKFFMEKYWAHHAEMKEVEEKLWLKYRSNNVQGK